MTLKNVKISTSTHKALKKEALEKNKTVQQLLQEKLGYKPDFIEGLKTQQQTLLEHLKTVSKAGDYSIVINTQPHMRKTSRLDGSAPGEYENVTKWTFIKANLGTNYQEEMSKRLEVEYTSKESYMEPLKLSENKGFISKLFSKFLPEVDKFSNLLFKHKTKDQIYLRIFLDLAEDSASHSIYFTQAGRQLEASEVEMLKRDFFDKQSANTVPIIGPKIENVKYLADGSGNVLINELSSEIIARAQGGN